MRVNTCIFTDWKNTFPDKYISVMKDHTETEISWTNNMLHLMESNLIFPMVKYYKWWRHKAWKPSICTKVKNSKL